MHKNDDLAKTVLFWAVFAFYPNRFLSTKNIYLYYNRAGYNRQKHFLTETKKIKHFKMKRGDIMIMVEETKQKIGLERYITKIMLDLGVPAHLKGYHYIREAILLSEQDMEVVSSVTKLLYPEIAKTYRTTSQKVERAIRNAIEVSWSRGNTDTMEELFGYSSAEGKNRPTNSEYIARIADKIRLDLRTETLAS